MDQPWGLSSSLTASSTVWSFCFWPISDWVTSATFSFLPDSFSVNNRREKAHLCQTDGTNTQGNMLHTCKRALSHAVTSCVLILALSEGYLCVCAEGKFLKHTQRDTNKSLHSYKKRNTCLKRSDVSPGCENDKKCKKKVDNRKGLSQYILFSCRWGRSMWKKDLLHVASVRVLVWAEHQLSL